jgi:hypothetical protein
MTRQLRLQIKAEGRAPDQMSDSKVARCGHHVSSRRSETRFTLYPNVEHSRTVSYGVMNNVKSSFAAPSEIAECPACHFCWESIAFSQEVSTGQIALDHLKIYGITGSSLSNGWILEHMLLVTSCNMRCAQNQQRPRQTMSNRC